MRHSKLYEDWHCSSGVEHVPQKHEDLGSIPSLVPSLKTEDDTRFWESSSLISYSEIMKMVSTKGEVVT